MPIRLKLGTHAQYRLMERGIDPANVKKVVADPDFTEPAYDGKMRSNKVLEDGRTLEVIYCKEDFRGHNDHFIVTAYYLDV